MTDDKGNDRDNWKSGVPVGAQRTFLPLLRLSTNTSFEFQTGHIPRAVAFPCC